MLCTGFSGFQYRGVSSGQHTVRVRATSTVTGDSVLSNSATIQVGEIVIDINGITGK